MSRAKDLFAELELDKNLDCRFKFNNAHKMLKELSHKQYYLLGSKSAHYDFEDGSRIVWHSAPSRFEVQA